MKGGKSKGKADNKLGVKKSAAQTKKEKNAAKDPNKPKRPASAFFVFMEDFRKQYKEKHPGNKSVAAVGKAGGDKWKHLTDAEKAPYIAKAEKRKAEYEKLMDAYNRKQAGEAEEDEESDKSKSEVDEEDGSDEGIGKTTLIVRVLETLRNSNPNLKVQGFYTREIREGTERIGFEVVTLDGRTGLLASNKISSAQSLRWPTVGRYRVDVASFESLALPELQVREDTDLFIIDEIGKMELYSSSFFPAVLKVLQSNIPLLASIPITKVGRDIPGVR
ncbi:hypothetical protein KY289_018763 [Solanum tuberosum]|nr:hypothetical protein KY289_018763 [Solanum tuberosum]